MAFTENEKIILNHFFTNTDEPVFFVKNMHPEIWALMQAMYSRSKKSLRENFLELLQEDRENYEQLIEILKNRDSQIKIDNALEKAISFMNKWVLGYGHASIAEGAVVGIGLEKVSIIATKEIEHNRLSSFTEKSTRYVQYSRDSFELPEKIKSSKFGKEAEEYVTSLFDFYLELQEPVLDYIKKIVPRNENEPENAWLRACGARRFDAVRYLLPACTITSMGWTVNARQLAHGIKKFSSHQLEEMRTLGQKLKEEGKKILPSLLRYAEESRYLFETEKDMFNFFRNYPVKNEDETPVKLVNFPKDIENQIVASIIYKYVHAPFNEVETKVKAMSAEEKEKIFDLSLEKMGSFDWPIRELEHGYFTWDILMDYGAYRDLQRHRICTHTPQLTTAFHGYSVPEDIVNAGFKNKFDEIMARGKMLFEKIYELYPYEAQYVVPLAFKKRHIMTANLREMHHYIKIRTTPQSHASYRDIARRMYIILKEKFPMLSKYIVCNMNEEELGRLKSEIKIEEKIDKNKI